MKFTSTCPIFRILDEKKAKEFYVDLLGFSITFEHRFADHMPLYIGLELGNFELHLSEHTGDATPHSGVYLEMDSGLKNYHDSLIEKDLGFDIPKLEDSGFGTVCLDITDPFNNRLSFNEPKK